MQETLQKLSDSLTRQGATLIAYSEAPNIGNHAGVVLASWRGESVCWIWNKEDLGFSFGVYDRDGTEAKKSFKTRVQSYT